jgi:hypothetical protein
MAFGSSVAANVLNVLAVESADPARAVVVVTTAAAVVMIWPAAVGLDSERAAAPAVVETPADMVVATRSESEATFVGELERATP